VRDLIESLWLNYPVGSLLLWDSRAPVVERLASDEQRPQYWLVDGQQRTTALCILSGRKPYWWPSGDEWEKLRTRYDVRFDVHAKEPPYFLVADAVIRKTREPRYVPVAKLLNLDLQKEADSKALQELAKAIKLAGLCDGMDAMEVYSRLDRVRRLREREMVKVTIDHELEDVVEIFSRLNSRGTRVTEADIYLGIVASHNPGWVKNDFLPFLGDLEDRGFGIGPNLLFRSLTAIGTNRVRFHQVDPGFWRPDRIAPAWSVAQGTWRDAIMRLREYGVMTNSILPTDNALVTLSAILCKFPHAEFRHCFYWLLQASRYGRYSGSATTALDEDLKDVAGSEAQDEALARLLGRLPIAPLSTDDFLRDYGDSRFGRFLLYLLVWANRAVDWDEKKHRLGFQGSDAWPGFQPQWHHIFPRKYLGSQFESSEIDALANIAVIGPSINIRISAKAPMDYINRYGIDGQRLDQQYVEREIASMPVGEYPKWLRGRATKLAKAGNAYMAQLGAGLHGSAPGGSLGVLADADAP
jgi:hypothetical protein